MLFIKGLVVWIIMAIAAVANGLLREVALNKYLGEFYALPISGVLLSILIAAIIYFSMNWFVVQNHSYYVTLGLFWAALTLSFEYGFGYFSMDMELSEINQIFNVSSGNLFTLVLAVTLLGPIVIARFKNN